MSIISPGAARPQRTARETLLAFGTSPDLVKLPTEPPARSYGEWRLDVETIQAFNEPDYAATSW